MVWPQIVTDTPHASEEQLGIGCGQTHVPFWHPSPFVQLPQLMVLPQPSGTLPHVALPHAWAFNVGVQHLPALHSCPVLHELGQV
jgi:hypothetical protein